MGHAKVSAPEGDGFAGANPVQLDDAEEKMSALTLATHKPDIEEDLYHISDLAAAVESIDDEASRLAIEELLKADAQLEEDKKMAESIAAAVQADSDVIREELAQEHMAREDHALAMRLEQDPAEPAPVLRITNHPHFDDSHDDNLIAELAEKYMPSKALIVAPRSGDKDVPTVKAKKECVACLSAYNLDKMLNHTCDHAYCAGCLGEVFDMSLRDESYYPPRCCGEPIALDDAKHLLPCKLAEEFEIKAPELDTADRTYCRVQTCSAWISLDNIDAISQIGTCSKCQATTCTMCKAEEHAGDCPKDGDLQLLIDAVKENGWQRCPTCRRVVELAQGCNHMTQACCRCHAEFCYVCAAPWKNCHCPQWDENNLVNRAEEIVDRPNRNPGGAAVNPVQRAAAVADVVQNLRENHECYHLNWRWTHGAASCEICSHFLPVFTFECTQCAYRVCRRCRDNRTRLRRR